jgi:hypothetical protein
MKLSEPIEAHGETLAELEFRRPVGGDVAACGYPFSFTIGEDGGTTITPLAPAITALISRLGDIPLSAARSLQATDWSNAMMVILGFFGQSIQAPSSPGASISRGSGNGTLVKPSH